MTKRYTSNAVKEPREDYFPLRGGLDLTSPPYQINPGRMIDCFRYEIAASGGYKPIDGYERVDGLGLPSEAVFQYMTFTDTALSLAVGTEITGDTSGATGTVLLAGDVDFNDDMGVIDMDGTTVVYLSTTDVFEDGEDITVSGAVVGTIDTAYTPNTETADSHEQYYHWLAVEARRALVAQVPGSGPLRGVWRYNSTLYAFRDNAGGTACVMHKEDAAAGWAAVDLGAVITFTSGNGVPVVGQVITGLTSAATATIRKITKTSGDWAADTAAGTIIVTGIANGPFTAGGEEITSATTQFTIGGGAVVETTLLPGGSYRFENTNFGGSASTIKMYGCDGENKAFEFDGTTFVKITTGMAVDAPIAIFEHKKHLFLAFAGGSLQHSPITDPTGTWSVVIGAGELGMGEEIVDGVSLPGGILGIWCKDSIHLLSGSSSGATDPWVLSTHSKETGAVAGTIQNAGRVLFLNNTGIAEMSATNAFGSFKNATISPEIQPLIDLRKKIAVSSVAVTSKNQYRIFFSDGYFLTATFQGKNVQFTQGSYDIVVRCISAPTRADDELGNIYFGSDTGFVYKMDSGVSLDDSTMTAYCRLPYSFQGAPRQKKRYYEVAVELDLFSASQLNLQFFPDFSMTTADIPQHQTVDVSMESSSSGLWNLVDWNSFSWVSDGDSTGGGGGLARGRVDAVAPEMGLMLYFNAENTVTPLHVLNGIFIYYQFRGRVK